MDVRLADESDIAALHRLDDDSAEVDAINGEKFYVLRRYGVIEYYLHEQGLFVAVDGNRMTGDILTHIISQMHAVDRLAWIEHIGVHPDFRGQNVGLTLLRAVEKYYHGKADALYTKIHPLNEKSLHLFNKWQDGSYERVCVYKSL